MYPNHNMNGFKFTVGNLPYAYHTQSLMDPEPKSPMHVFKDHFGYEIEMLMEASRRMNFTYELVNPEDQIWGSLSNGTWSGNIGCVVNGHCDFLTGAIIFSPNRHKVLRATMTFDKDLYLFGTGLPRPLVNYWSLLNPFQVRRRS